ncbi:MAG: M20/M25/M40 family metallo-hydrolase, partial [Acidaminococcales bacterium]|nr:M20/M25/M40 family metallo-hydrolase [Acidaminococcales bacterium]
MDTHRMVQEFIELVSTDAASKNERLVADKLIKKLAEIGLDIHEDDAGKTIGGNTGNIIATMQGTRPGHLMLCAHMDRVEPGMGIRPQITEDGHIASDGKTILAADNIAGVVIILEALRRVKESGQAHPTVEVIFTVCEEIGLAGSRYLDYSRIQSKMGYVFDTSGNVGRVVSRAPFKGVVTVEVFGKAAHAGNFPERGVNAIMAAAHILDGVKEGRLSDTATSNFGCINGGSNIGTVCDYVVIRGELRNHSLQGLKDYYAYIEEYCNKRIQDTNATCELSLTMDYDGFVVQDYDPCMKLLIKVMEKMRIPPFVVAGMGGMDC